MGRLGIKIFKAQIIVILIVFITTIVFFNFLSQRYLILSTQSDLKKEAFLISDILQYTNFNSEDIKNKLIEKRYLRVAGKFFDSEIVILNNQGNILYKNSYNIDPYFLKILSKSDNVSISGFVSQRKRVFDKKGKLKGTIFLMTKIKDLNHMTNLMMKSLWISFVVASLIASIIGIVFEKSITKPIRKLMYKMNNFSVKIMNNLESIKTGDEIEQLDMCFMNMGMKIKNYNDEQDKFFQNTSHELKTPLMSIQGYAEAIKDGIIGKEELDESLDIIIQESQRLKKLVDEIIYITKLENKEDIFEFKKISINEILYDSIKRLRALTQIKNLNIKTQIEYEYIGMFDKEKILRVFINIIGNAIRYAESTVIIKIIKNNNYLEILVIDDGVGFKNNEEEKVFDRFYKGKLGDTGLGLFIAKIIIEKHNGRILAYNNGEKGAVFKIIIPIE